MNSSVIDEFDEALVPVDVQVDDAMIHVRFKGGLEIDSPVSEFPRLNGRGYGIHWPDVDEDITVRGLIARAKPRLAEVA